MSRIIKTPLDGTEVINFVGTTSDQNSGSTTVQDIADLAGGGSSQIQSNETIAAPYTGVELPTVAGVNVGDTKTVKFNDGTVVNYTWDGTAWILDFVQDYSEERICLNTATPAFIATIVIEQTNVGLFFNYSGNPFDITSFKINGNELLSGNINVYNAGGAYVYTNQLVSLFNNWMATNGYTGTIDDDIDNNTGVFLTGLSGGVLTFEIITDEGGNVHIYADTSILITTSIPADVNNPTLAEVETWKNANLTLQQQTSGTILTYFVPGDGGSCENPDYTWTLNKGSELITLSNKRVFNTKTVYVDAGSGSNVTGRRGYREFPFKTLDAAIAVCETGDLLKVFPGTYIQNTPILTLINIDCDLGVSWTLNSHLFLDNDFNTNIVTNFKFDEIKKTTLLPSINKRFIFRNSLGTLNLEFNRFLNVRSSIRVKESNIKSKYVSDGGFYTGLIIPNQIANITIDNLNLSGDYDQITVGPEFGDNSISNSYINNLKLTGKNTTSHVAANVSAADTGINKIYTHTLNSVNYVNSDIYITPSGPLDGREIWSGLTAQTSSGRIFSISEGVRQNTIVNFTINNIKSIGECGAIIGTTFNNSIIVVNIKGVFEKGVPLYTTKLNSSINSKIIFNLDLECHTSMGLFLGFTNGASANNNIESTNQIIVTGRIKTRYAGMSCISIGQGTAASNNTNGTILLKDLTLINDGTVSPIMCAVQENVVIQNVTSNSLISDPNITEIGQSIIRNTNYK
jgi:hypothetical protein